MSLSLQQKILASSNYIGTLQTNLATLTVNVAEAVAFHKNIIHDDANVAELANRVTANAGNIGSLQSTTATQASEIATITSNVATNAQAIADYNTQFVQQISAERVRAEAVEATLTSNLSSEQARAEAAESDITSAYTAMVNTEITDRTSADSALSASISAETAARTTSYNSIVTNTFRNLFAIAWFTQVLEAEGVLSAGSYPFCSGNGTPQSAGFGIGIPFGYDLKGYYVQCKSTDVSRNIGLRLEHYNDGATSSPTTITNITLGSSGYSKTYASIDSTIGNTQSSGSVCVKIQSVASSLTDVNARYRICLYFCKSSTL